MNCPNCNGHIPMVGWNDKEFFEHCPWCGISLEIEREKDDTENVREPDEAGDSPVVPL